MDTGFSVKFSTVSYLPAFHEVGGGSLGYRGVPLSQAQSREEVGQGQGLGCGGPFPNCRAYHMGGVGMPDVSYQSWMGATECGSLQTHQLEGYSVGLPRQGPSPREKLVLLTAGGDMASCTL